MKTHQTRNRWNFGVEIRNVRSQLTESIKSLHYYIMLAEQIAIHNE